MIAAVQQEQPISIETQLPETVFRCLQQYLDRHPSISVDDVVSAAVATYLMLDEITTYAEAQ